MFLSSSYPLRDCSRGLVRSHGWNETGHLLRSLYSFSWCLQLTTISRYAGGSSNNLSLLPSNDDRVLLEPQWDMRKFIENVLIGFGLCVFEIRWFFVGTYLSDTSTHANRWFSVIAVFCRSVQFPIGFFLYFVFWDHLDEISLLNFHSFFRWKKKLDGYLSREISSILDLVVWCLLFERLQNRLHSIAMWVLGKIPFFSWRPSPVRRTIAKNNKCLSISLASIRQNPVLRWPLWKLNNQKEAAPMLDMPLKIDQILGETLTAGWKTRPREYMMEEEIEMGWEEDDVPEDGRGIHCGWEDRCSSRKDDERAAKGVYLVQPRASVQRKRRRFWNSRATGQWICQPVGRIKYPLVLSSS